jgi:hypothetical protein
MYSLPERVTCMYPPPQVANILHAMAVLHIVDVALLDWLEGRVCEIPLEGTTPQGAANVAWSVAVFHPMINLNRQKI